MLSHQYSGWLLRALFCPTLSTPLSLPCSPLQPALSAAGHPSLSGTRVSVYLLVCCLLCPPPEPKSPKGQEFCLVQHYILRGWKKKPKTWHVIVTNKYLFRNTWTYWSKYKIAFKKKNKHSASKMILKQMVSTLTPRLLLQACKP